MPRSFVLLHNSFPFFYSFVRTRCFLQNVIKNCSRFLRILVFPRKLFKLFSPACVQNGLLPDELFKATFVFLPRMWSKSLFSPELTSQHHCSIHNLLKISCHFSRIYSESLGVSQRVLKNCFLLNVPKTRFLRGVFHNFVLDNSSIERVEEFKYLGTTLTNQNSIQE